MSVPSLEDLARELQVYLDETIVLRECAEARAPGWEMHAMRAQSYLWRARSVAQRLARRLKEEG